MFNILWQGDVFHYPVGQVRPFRYKDRDQEMTLDFLKARKYAYQVLGLYQENYYEI